MPSFPVEAGIHRQVAAVIADLIRNPEGRSVILGLIQNLQGGGRSFVRIRIYRIKAMLAHRALSLWIPASAGNDGRLLHPREFPALWILDQVQNDGPGIDVSYGCGCCYYCRALARQSLAS